MGELEGPTLADQVGAEEVRWALNEEHLYVAHELKHLAGARLPALVDLDGGWPSEGSELCDGVRRG